MAKTVTTVVHLEDDMTGGKADETVPFAFKGQAYEIDLSTANAKEFHSYLKPYISAARPTNGRRANGAKPRSSGPDAKAIRAWAKTAKIKVPDRGRVPNDVVEAYLAAH